MKCEDCAVVDFCQAGFWYKNCKDWKGNNDDKRNTVSCGPRNDTDGVTIAVEGEPESIITGH